MLRFAYTWILRLHPRRFRQCFADEMLWIFDQSQGIPGAVKLLQDGFFSLARQWTLRAEYWREEDSVDTTLNLDGVPLFHSLESSRPRTRALLQGGVFTLIAFYIILVALKYSWNHPVFIQFSGIQFETISEDVPSGSPERSTSDANQKGSGDLAISRASRIADSKAISSVARKFAAVETHTPGSTSGTRVGFSPGVDNLTKPTDTIVSPSSVQSMSPSVTPSAVLRSYAGTYVSGPPNEIEVSITFEDGELVIEVPGEAKHTLVAMSATKFTIAGSTNDWIDFESQGYPIGSQAHISLSGRHLVVHRKFN